jgi:hypothetical protein
MCTFLDCFVLIFLLFYTKAFEVCRCIIITTYYYYYLHVNKHELNWIIIIIIIPPGEIMQFCSTHMQAW